MELTRASSTVKPGALSSRVTIGIIVCIGLLACLLTLWATATWGIGVSADSTVYIGAARSLLATGSIDDVDSLGQRVPLVHYPPLLPLVLAGISELFQMDPVSSARWLGAILFGINTILLGVVAWRLVKSPWLGIAGALLALVFTPMAAIHQMALSEPLYVLFALAALLALFQYLNGTGTVWLVAAGAATALAFTTRYAGAALVVTGALAILLVKPTRISLAIRDVALYSLIACFPMAGWFIRNRMVSGATSDFFGGKTVDPANVVRTIVSGLNSVSGWLLPGAIPQMVRIGLLLALAAWIIIVCRGRLDSIPAKLASLLRISIGSYVTIVLGTILFLDGTTPLDDRILLPLFAPLVLLMLAALQATLSTSRGQAWIPLALTVGLLFLTNAVRSPSYLLTSARNGRGYSGVEWRNSSLMRQLKSVPRDVPIYGTLPSSIRFLTNLPARQLPNIYNPRNRRKNADFGREISVMYQQSEDSGIVVVYFRGNAGGWYPEESELAKTCHLMLVASDDRASLYMSPNVLNRALAAPKREMAERLRPN